MITVVGVGHVFDIERQVRYLIKSRTPRAVGVELDPSRYEALTKPSTNRSVPLPYKLLAMTQMRLAKEFNSKVGQEMLAAVSEAQQVGAQVLFIDVDAALAFGRLWQTMSFKERIMMLMSGLTGLIVSKKKVEAEMQRYEENEDQYLQLLGEEFPTVKKVLIDDRNSIMAQRILKAEQQYGNVLAVVGDGHVEGIHRLIARDDVSVVRLKELRSLVIPEECSTNGTNCDVTVRFNLDE